MCGRAGGSLSSRPRMACTRAGSTGSLARYRAEGDAGLVPRSRRPKTSPNALSTNSKTRSSCYANNSAKKASTPARRRSRCISSDVTARAPSVSTIMRVLRRRGASCPNRRNDRSRRTSVSKPALPNECWQSDMTHWTLADGTHVEIINFLDDHTRLCVASVVVPVTRATDVADVFMRRDRPIRRSRLRAHRQRLHLHRQTSRRESRHGNTARRRSASPTSTQAPTTRKPAAKSNGSTRPSRSSWPNNPPPALTELQALLDRFVAYYNTQRPHRALGRRTPTEAFDAQIKAHPPASTPDTHFRSVTTKSTSPARSPSATTPSSTTSAWEPATAANAS